MALYKQGLCRWFVAEYRNVVNDLLKVWKPAKECRTHVCNRQQCEFIEKSNVFLCASSGNIHICSENLGCENSTISQNELICSVSGRLFSRRFRISPERLVSEYKLNPNSEEVVAYEQEIVHEQPVENYLRSRLLEGHKPQEDLENEMKKNVELLLLSSTILIPPKVVVPVIVPPPPVAKPKVKKQEKPEKKTEKKTKKLPASTMINPVPWDVPQLDVSEIDNVLLRVFGENATIEKHRKVIHSVCLKTWPLLITQNIDYHVLVNCAFLAEGLSVRSCGEVIKIIPRLSILSINPSNLKNLGLKDELLKETEKHFIQALRVCRNPRLLGCSSTSGSTSSPP